VGEAVELTVEDREKLVAIQFGFYGAHSRPADMEMRPPTKAEYRTKRGRLSALKKAWAALDQATQWRLVCGLNAMWTDEAEDHLPDVGPVVDGLLDEMRKSNGAPEEFVGLRRATALLWSVWCKNQLGGHVPIGSDVIAEIGAEVSALFRIPACDAERRVENALRDLEKDGSLPRRGTTRCD
jgi:hypothetical protein